ncbi:protein of unknown function [Candidatus Promineifilum breve]|uniref:DUF1360 domain-containing protein n=2 Tax=Candidatus Promineifilum breve TaxID=1806508 RepID=A0A160T639_9CHLR|nr:protein of unknown function [Candidatus Promineifilum breve]
MKHRLHWDWGWSDPSFLGTVAATLTLQGSVAAIGGLMSMSSFLVRALAVYALAVALTQKEGPGGVFGRARAGVIREFGEESSVAAGVQCPVCASFWLAWVVSLLPEWAARGLALAGVTVVVERLAQGQKLEIVL